MCYSAILGDVVTKINSFSSTKFACRVDMLTGVTLASSKSLRIIDT